MNTECDDKCGHEFYTAHLISGCLPCTQCCDDEKDELTKECMNSNKKCKMRFTPCLRVGTTPSRPSEQIFHLNTLPTAQTTTSIESEILTTQVNTVDKSVSGKFSSSITPTRSLNNEALITKAADSGKQDGISIINITVIMFMVVLALCLLLSANRFRHIRRSSREQNSSSNGGNDTARGRAPPRPCFSVINQPSQEPPSPPLNRSESPQANGSDSPELNDSASPQTDGSESPRPSENVSPQANETAPSQSNGSVSSQAIRAASHHSEPRGSVLVKSSQFSQEQVKANPGE